MTEPYTPAPEEALAEIRQNAISFDSAMPAEGFAAALSDWLEAHDREVRREALLSAAEALRGDQEVRDRNGVGWLPTNSLMGAARVLEHLAARR